MKDVSVLVNNLLLREISGPGGRAAHFAFPRYEALQGEWRYSSTLSLTLALDWVDIQCHAPTALPTGKETRNHCTAGWLGPRAGLDGCGKSCPHRDSISGPSRADPSGRAV